MIYEGITNGTYAPTTDSTLDDLNKFQYFLRRNFNNKFTHCKDMRLQLTVENLKSPPIISQVGTYTYNAARVIAKNLKPLCQINIK